MYIVSHDRDLCTFILCTMPSIYWALRQVIMIMSNHCSFAFPMNIQKQTNKKDGGLFCPRYLLQVSANWMLMHFTCITCSLSLWESVWAWHYFVQTGTSMKAVTFYHSNFYCTSEVCVVGSVPIWNFVTHLCMEHVMSLLRLLPFPPHAFLSTLLG